MLRTPGAGAYYQMILSANCYRLTETMIGTVTTSDSVESSSADADSASMALYLAASRTVIVARGTLQQTSASRANGLCTSSICSSANNTVVCTVMRPRVAGMTAFDRWKACAARVIPTLNTATPSQSFRNKLLSLSECEDLPAQLQCQCMPSDGLALRGTVGSRKTSLGTVKLLASPQLSQENLPAQRSLPPRVSRLYSAARPSL